MFDHAGQRLTIDVPANSNAGGGISRSGLEANVATYEKQSVSLNGALITESAACTGLTLVRGPGSMAMEYPVDKPALESTVNKMIEADDLVCGRCPVFIVTHKPIPNVRRFDRIGDRQSYSLAIDGLAAASYDSFDSLLKHHGGEILAWRGATSGKLLQDAITETAISVPSVKDLWNRAAGAAAVLVPIGWKAHGHAQSAPSGLQVAETSAVGWKEAALVRGQGTYYVNRTFDIRQDGASTVVTIGAEVARLESSRPTIQYVTVAEFR